MADLLLAATATMEWICLDGSTVKMVRATPDATYLDVYYLSGPEAPWGYHLTLDKDCKLELEAVQPKVGMYDGSVPLPANRVQGLVGHRIAVKFQALKKFGSDLQPAVDLLLS